MRRAVCKKCGAANHIDAVVCTRCGAKITSRESELEASLREGTFFWRLFRGPKRLLRKSLRFTRAAVYFLLGAAALAAVLFVTLLVVPLGWEEIPPFTPERQTAGEAIYQKLAPAIRAGGRAPQIPVADFEALGAYLLLTPQTPPAGKKAGEPGTVLPVFTPADDPEGGACYRQLARRLTGTRFGLKAELRGDEYVFTFGGRYAKPALPWRLVARFHADRTNEGVMTLTGLMFNNLPLGVDRGPEIVDAFARLLGEPRMASKFLNSIQSGAMYLFPNQNDKIILTFTPRAPGM